MYFTFWGLEPYNHKIVFHILGALNLIIINMYLTNWGPCTLYCNHKNIFHIFRAKNLILIKIYSHIGSSKPYNQKTVFHILGALNLTNIKLYFTHWRP